ncbi:hypothetical protein SAMN05421505_109226 [Sinosporangium album]|uniref:Uncharacterized protein n=1 Tax=Sinosporangium album TaxID=504805 RepID=A0A1G7YGV0_9ACTN|nr:hypothetical protein [Sinosporangium album]SDG95100.1 hypothetical protein SAMN05421505_109226 [Sinosporangium album]
MHASDPYLLPDMLDLLDMPGLPSLPDLPDLPDLLNPLNLSHVHGMHAMHGMSHVRGWSRRPNLRGLPGDAAFVHSPYGGAVACGGTGLVAGWPR